MSNRRVLYPEFELVGPSCEARPCKGVLVDTVDIQTREYFQKCSECGSEFNRCPVSHKVAYAVRTILALAEDDEGRHLGVVTTLRGKDTDPQGGGTHLTEPTVGLAAVDDTLPTVHDFEGVAVLDDRDGLLGPIGEKEN